MFTERDKILQNIIGKTHQTPLFVNSLFVSVLVEVKIRN